MDEDIWGLDDAINLHNLNKQEQDYTDEEIWQLDDRTQIILSEGVKNNIETVEIVDDDDDDVKPVKFDNAFVYTTKLDDMSVFNRNEDFESVAELTKQIEKESKPTFKSFNKEQLKFIPSKKLKEIRNKIDKFNQDCRKYNEAEQTFGDPKLFKIPVVKLVNIQSRNFLRTNTDFKRNQSKECEKIFKTKYNSNISIYDDFNDELTTYQIVNTSDLNKQIQSLHRIVSNNTDVLKDLITFDNNIEIRNCCWYKKQNNLMELCKDVQTKSLIRFVSSLHTCLPGQCACCCNEVTHLNPKINVDTKRDLDLQPSNKTMLNEYIKTNSFNKARITSLLQSSPADLCNPIDKALTYCKNPNNIQPIKPTLYKSLPPKYNRNPNILSIKNRQSEIEVYQTGEQYRFVKSCDMYDFGLYDISPQVACCWYKRESIIMSSNAPTLLCNLARKPHTCTPTQCDCCCKDIFTKAKSESFTLHKKPQSKINNYNQILNRIKSKSCEILNKSAGTYNTKGEMIKFPKPRNSIIKKNRPLLHHSNKTKNKNHKNKNSNNQSPKFIHRTLNDKVVQHTLFVGNKDQNESNKSEHSYCVPKQNNVNLIKPVNETINRSEIMLMPTEIKALYIPSNNMLEANVERPMSPQNIDNLRLLPEYKYLNDETILNITSDYYIEVNEKGYTVAKLKHPLDQFSLESLQSMLDNITCLAKSRTKPGKYYFDRKINTFSLALADPTAAQSVTKLLTLKKQRFSEAFDSFQPVIKIQTNKWGTPNMDDVSKIKINEVFSLSQKLEKPPLPVNKPPSPVNNSPSPVNKLPSPVNKPPSSVNNPPSPVNNPPSPVNNPRSLVNKPPSPVNKPHKKTARTFEEEFLNSILEQRDSTNVASELSNLHKRKAKSMLPEPSQKLRVLTPKELTSVPVINVMHTKPTGTIENQLFDMCKTFSYIDKSPPSTSNTDNSSKNKKQSNEACPILKKLLVLPHIAPSRQDDNAQLALQCSIEKLEDDIRSVTVIEID